MSAFPAITAAALNEIPYEPMDNAVRSEPVNGLVITRKRFTGEIWQFGDIHYDVEANDLALIKAHWASVGTHTVFNYSLSGETYTVRYRTPIKFIALPAGRTHIMISLQSA